jgi:UPF0716 protein FxsA
MRPLKRIALGLLLLPTAEIAAFVAVASFTGLGTAVVLLVLTSIAGVLVLRRLGENAVARLRAATGGIEMTSVNLEGSQAATALGGILLVIPGFITGVLGALVIFPTTRKWLAAAFARLLATPRPQSEPPVIDLEPDQWQRLPSPKLPRRRRKEEP